MTRLVLLDSSPLSLLTHPLRSQEIAWWAAGLTQSGVRVGIPEIVDYEVRRELLRAGKTRGIRNLDVLKADYLYLPLTTPVMLLAAELWADVRRAGQPTAGDQRLDVDVILAAQATILCSEGYEVVIATDNVRHLSRFVDAKTWREIA